MKINEEILKEREEAFNKVSGPRVGDYLKLPYGLITRFTHEWDESMQTGGSEHGQYFLGNGYLSYSGSLDSGVKKTDIRLTGELKSGSIWFFDKNVSGAGRGKDFRINFRVFELVENADLSGLPQIKEFEKQKYLSEKVDKITRINGNGQPYTLPLPQLLIITDYKPLIERISSISGLLFVPGWGGFIAQPEKHEQLAKVFLCENFKTTFYNNWTFANTLKLEMNR